MSLSPSFLGFSLGGGGGASSATGSGRVSVSSTRPTFLGGVGTGSTIKKSAKLDGVHKVVIVLDESGSMSPVQMDIIRSINNLLKEQKEIKDRPAVFTLVKFSGNNNIKAIMQNVPLSEVQLLSSADYRPDGGTALYDAIGETINAFEDESNVLMVIVTDGQENESVRYNKDEITRKVDLMKATKAWNYVYICCDDATEQQGFGLGFSKSAHSSNMQARGQRDMARAIGGVSKCYKECRLGGMSYGAMNSKLNSWS